MSRQTQDMGFGKNNPVSHEELCWITAREYSSCGMFDEQPMFEWVNASDEVIYREIIQFSPWSSGPMECHALKRVSDGRLFSFWTQEEVDEL